MDLFRPRADPALIVVLGLLAAPGAKADCAGLDGRFDYDARSTSDGKPKRLADLADGKKNALVRVDKPATGGGWASDAPRTRAQVTHLAATATLSVNGGKPRLAYHDRQGNLLVELPLAEGWSCNGSRLLRSSEQYAGLGDDLKTLQVVETLVRNASGNLVYTETVTVVEPRRGKPATREARFPAAR